MAVSNLNAVAQGGLAARAVLMALAALAALAVHAPLSAAVREEKQAILIEAQSTDMDLKNNNLIYRKVRLSQGNMSIVADVATGTGVDFENSHWVFRGNVKIAMETGLLTSEEADITFANKLLAKAVVNGKPAAFEEKLAKSGKLVKGHADTIDYDVAHGAVHFSKNAWLSDGQNEIRGESLKYDLLKQTISAEASEQASQRVHIIITPPPKTKP
jgi:lipopolysaccharide transport protein LptA